MHAIRNFPLQGYAIAFAAVLAAITLRWAVDAQLGEHHPEIPHIYPCEEGLALFCHDVEERKRAEQALRESEERLAKSTSLLELIANGLPVLIYYLDTDERYRFANAMYERWPGISERPDRRETLDDSVTLSAGPMPERRASPRP